MCARRVRELFASFDTAKENRPWEFLMYQNRRKINLERERESGGETNYRFQLQQKAISVTMTRYLYLVSYVSFSKFIRIITMHELQNEIYNKY